MAVDESSSPPDVMTLYSWPSAFNLPSLDPFCLSLITYLTLCARGSPHWQIQPSSTPQLSPNGAFPMLLAGAEPIAGTSNILAFLKKRDGADLDTHLTESQRAQATALICLIEENLNNALLYTWWLESENFVKSTRPKFSKALGFISRYYVPNQLREKARFRLKGTRTIESDGKEVPEVYLEARDIYKELAKMLGDKPFFFGDRPTSLDAVAYGHLALHTYPSLANVQLFTMLSFEFPTLVDFVKRIQTKLDVEANDKLNLPISQGPVNESMLAWMIKDPKAILYSAWRQVQDNVTHMWHGDGGQKTKEERKELIYNTAMVIGGIVFFVGYAFASGIIQISHDTHHDHDDDDDDEEYYEDDEA
ncbi:uncharacterized protein BJ171DRAFT_177122 [Polychytrium aggregatum]|uniref:uncharacterized protein n=1 Tax=Polychytrium aggregatum TaxID=110093 RepID=UPI0022FE5944|nr:uncharacterized protein BJ171DRAFT_177122 [Polychytrium aggregatum]KAI9202560.1 hypothetical protein BJ171DRAFT_177122 [Polychytrium aggregatum]